MRTAAAILFCVFVLALVQLVAALVQPLLALIVAIGLGVLSLVLLRLFPGEFRRWWSAVAVVTGGSLAGILARHFGDPSNSSWVLWLSPVAASSTAELAILGDRLTSRRCPLCRKRIGSGATYNCPRCGLRVCEECWSFENYRCRLCERNKVPIFRPDALWWDAQFGPPIKSGLCQFCQTPASATELRACGKCGRPQCRACWDFANGRCTHCDWLVRDLPTPLRRLHGSLRSSEGAVGRARSQRE
jgi:Prokaryotic RING finger family 2